MLKSDNTEMCLVTGVNGFVGSALANYLSDKNLNVLGSLRLKNENSFNLPFQTHAVGNLTAFVDWKKILADVKVVFHLASIVHQAEIKDRDMYKTVVFDATMNLARQAAEVGVKRLVYISTGHVYGVNSHDLPLSEDHIKNPNTLYSETKLETEYALQEFAEKSNLEIVIIRPPLVYGKGAKGNFLELAKLIKKISLLPFGSAFNKRSFIGIHNLIDFIYTCGFHKQASNKVFNISDNYDLTMNAFCKEIATVLNKKTLLLPISPVCMQLFLSLIQKNDLYYKMFGNLQLDISHAKNTLGWLPKFTVQDELRQAFI